MRTSIKVAVRVRPLNKREVDLDAKFIIQMDGKKTSIINNKMNEQNIEGVSDTTREAMRLKDFTFDFSFWTVDKEEARYCNQEQVYQCLGIDVVDSGFEGYNACVFAYGQTGSGKTYTMMGNPGDVGLIPRICQELFHRMTDETTSYRTEVSYLEIYNEKVRDLLKSTNQSHVVHNLRVREHPKEGPYVQGLSKYIVSSFEEIESLMMKGNSIRTTASTNMNDVSSRSHAIFTIVFTQATIKEGIPSEKTSKIHLVDLAGSERATATGATGKRLREGGSINKSLVSLGTVIKQLAEVSEKGARPGKGHFIAYRDSVLTWLLKDSLGGNSRTIMITTISPADVNYAESLSALRYANRAKDIINRPTVNEDQNVKLIRELKEEIERLKAMVGGDIDSISTPKVKERLHESEARMKVLTEEWSEKWKDIANILKEQDTLALRKEGLGVVLDSALPHLIGIDDDILSTGIMLYHLKEGKTRIGRSDASPPVDIVIAGQEVEKEHCVIKNAISMVSLIPQNGSSCFVNGYQVHEPTKLTQGAVIMLGKTNMFRYNNPAEAAQMKEQLQKSGMTFSLSRTSLLSQSMTDLYRSSENLSTSSSGWELEQSHREEQERIEELRSQIKELEDNYHYREEERINKQVGLEMELEKRQKLLERACNDLEKVQLEMVQAHETGGSIYKTPKAAQIGELLKKLDEREEFLSETSRVTRERLLEEMESMRLENEKEKDKIHEKLTSIEDKFRMKETEIKLLQDELQLKKQAAKDHDSEDQKVVNEEKQLLRKMEEDFESLFHKTSSNNDLLKVQLDELDEQNENLKKTFEVKEIEMRDRWKNDVDTVAEENKEIEEAWSDLKEQEKEYTESLQSDKLNERERNEIEQEIAQLHNAKQILKVEEERVAVHEQHILDAIEAEMDKWEQHKKREENEIKVKIVELAKGIGSSDLNQLISTIEAKESYVGGLLQEVEKQSTDVVAFERTVAEKTVSIHCDIEDLMREKHKLNDEQCKSVIKLEGDVIDNNEELIKLENKLNEDLKEIEEERESLKMLQKFHDSKQSQELVDKDQVLDKLKLLPLTKEEQNKVNAKQKELEKIQTAVDKANEELEETVRQFDQARDTELDIIELERVDLQERVRQDRINALVEQEVKRRMFEKKVHREEKRQLERDREKQEREEEIKRLREAHFREIKQLNAKFARRSGHVRRTMTPSRSNPYVTVMSADSERDVPRRKSTGSVMYPESIQITIPFYRLQCYGSDSHYEYEVKIVTEDDVWSVMRRYKQFREFHLNLKNKYPQVGVLVFPPKKFFSKTEKVAAERRQQLEFYMRSVIEISTQIPSCVLHSSQSQFLSKQVLCDFDSFFRKGLFENTKYGTT